MCVKALFTAMKGHLWIMDVEYPRRMNVEWRIIARLSGWEIKYLARIIAKADLNKPYIVHVNSSLKIVYYLTLGLEEIKHKVESYKKNKYFQWFLAVKCGSCNHNDKVGTYWKH